MKSYTIVWLSVLINFDDSGKHSLKPKLLQEIIMNISESGFSATLPFTTGLAQGLKPMQLPDNLKTPVYLASPYSTGSLADNSILNCLTTLGFRRMAVENYLHQAVLRGVTMYSPIAHWAEIGKKKPAVSHKQFLKADKEILSGCGSLLVLTLPGWENSKGVLEEIETAKHMGIPIHYTSHKDVSAKLQTLFTKSYDGDEYTYPQSDFWHFIDLMDYLEIRHIFGGSTDGSEGMSVMFFAGGKFRYLDNDRLITSSISRGVLQQTARGMEHIQLLAELLLFEDLGSFTYWEEKKDKEMKL